MLSRSEFEQAISIFLVELNYLIHEASDSELRTLPKFDKAIDEYLPELHDPANDAAQTLRFAFSYLDEYCDADKERLYSTAYDAYKISQSQSNDE